MRKVNLDNNTLYNRNIKVGDFCVINRCLCEVTKIGKIKVYFKEYHSYMEDGIYYYNNIPYANGKGPHYWNQCIKIEDTENKLFKYPFKISNNSKFECFLDDGDKFKIKVKEMTRHET